MGMEQQLALDFALVVEVAAIESAKTMGWGDRHAADLKATEAMRQAIDALDIIGTVVIGEGERDKAPMLYIDEKLGRGKKGEAPEIDIAVDPLEGTNLCATGKPNAITVLAVSEKGGLLHAPDIYMDKIIVGPRAKGRVDLTKPVKENLEAVADALRYNIRDLVVIVLDRPRNDKLIQDIRAAGARIKLISDGDLSAGIAAAVIGVGVHAVMGIGGSPEGVLTAAALKCLGGDMQGRFWFRDEKEKERFRMMGNQDTDKVFKLDELAPGENIIFCASGVTSGELLKGVRFFGGGHRVNTIVMTSKDQSVRFIDSIYVTKEGTPIHVGGR